MVKKLPTLTKLFRRLLRRGRSLGKSGREPACYKGRWTILNYRKAVHIRGEVLGKFLEEPREEKKKVPILACDAE